MAVSVAVVGLGYWGPKLSRSFARLPGAILHTLCDSSTERLRAVGSEYPRTRLVSNYERVISDPSVDAVVLATPVGTHYSLAREALEAGKHVFVEKPLAQSVVECEKLIRIARVQQRVLMVGHVFLYNAAVRKVKELVESGALGRIYYVYAQRLNLGIIRHDVNALWNFAPHDVSVLNYWLGSSAESVSARGFAYLQPGVEDVVFLSLEYPEGVGANIHVSWLDPHKVRRMTVVGSERMVEFDDTNPEARLVIYEKRAISSRMLGREQRVEDKGVEEGVRTRSGDAVIPHVPFEEPLIAECREFVQCIVDGRRPLSDGTEGCNVVQVLEAATRSLEQRASVNLPIEVAAGSLRNNEE